MIGLIIEELSLKRPSRHLLAGFTMKSRRKTCNNSRYEKGDASINVEEARSTSRRICILRGDIFIFLF